MANSKEPEGWKPGRRHRSPTPAPVGYGGGEGETSLKEYRT